jgi:L-Ala-D/L-Glu epimerase / N-acetyl-D-glutamate racemase
MKLILHTFKLELKHTFSISRRSFDSLQNLVVEVNHDGISGFGEATHNPYYKNTEVEKMVSKLEYFREIIETELPESPEIFWKKMAPMLSDFPFALCALDVAMHDWFARKAGMPLYQFWGLELSEIPKTSFTLGIDTPENMIKRMNEMPWDCYKIKLGTPNDIQLVKTLREHTNAKFWVDANCAWTTEETIEKSFHLKDLDVEFIEQPMPADEWKAMKKVFQNSALPLIADESCRTEKDIEKCSGRFHGINIKVMKCGGLTPALRMIKKAKNKGLKVMVGCMTESTVGISAIAHLLPLLDYADMDGPLFLKHDIAKGVKITRAGIIFPKENGTGVQLLRD